MTDPRRELSLDLPAVHRAVRVARSVVRRFARLEGVADADVEAILLVLSELLANAIDHGGGGAAMHESENGGVRMRTQVLLEAERWSVRVHDEGGGDPEPIRQLLGSQEPPDLEDERGRGFFLMNQLTDELSVERSEDGRGLTIVARKRYAP